MASGSSVPLLGFPEARREVYKLLKSNPLNVDIRERNVFRCERFARNIIKCRYYFSGLLLNVYTECAGTELSFPSQNARATAR